ncbi:hypothetical protein BASA50_008667 [Batrachochytrium salamandrivorans]|uniref:Uncharacterized protein n=1 Tax=Batrachochytrium salamandrivorans TaxID=1357716 RepID=A0ABQ8F3G1_9FUNG|nr:hypothetical protein BASA62_004560 [Batrachochytrium salamandrivorans]KAH6583620.1 hypothetical protein BASA60_001363 [Batrachochytrium salamandrivorans]KAH6591491.1 hypothetical protein BASA50_008667 [Batrachochytrium salamandrivorans]KAH9274773.1 hypothetical protein BASA83_002980 [Batrachochytrium salamandrivorans]
MKFNALVVAAMVITSAHAGQFGLFTSWLGINGGNQDPVSSPDSPEHGPGSVLPSNSQDSTLDDAQDPDPYNQDPVDGSDDGDKKPTCDSIIDDLKKLQVKMLGLDEQFRNQLPTLYELKSRADGLKDEEMDDYHVSRKEVETTLEDIKAEFINLSAKYSEGWVTLIADGCWNDYLHLMSPEGMMQISMFFDELRGSSENEKIHGEDVVSLDRK